MASVELRRIGALPSRRTNFSSPYPPSVVEVFPGIYLVASIIEEKNQCVLELVQPNTSLLSSPQKGSTFSPREKQKENPAPSSFLAPRRLSEIAKDAVPPQLRAAFRLPRIIQLLAEDEGVIRTVQLVREQLSTAATSPLIDSKYARSPLSSSLSALPTRGLSMDSVYVHFFIGTSNGTVLVGNALRGTILAIAQFQYNHRFLSETRGQLETTTSVPETAPGASRQPPPSFSSSGGVEECKDHQSSSSGRAAPNQAISKFAVHQYSDDVKLNPSLSVNLTSAMTTVGIGQQSPSNSSVSTLRGVYVVHEGGKIVLLNREALDIFLTVSMNQLDGQRPHLLLEWSPGTSKCSFPVAGPASHFFSTVQHVYYLTPPSYGSLEEATCPAGSSPTARRRLLAIKDADVFFSTGNAPLHKPLTSGPQLQNTLVTCGSLPVLAFYSLHVPTSHSSATRAVKAVRNMVAGVAKSLWFGALGTAGHAEPPKQLEKVTAPTERAFLQGDSWSSGVQVDPTQQWAAFYVEGAGRIYIADVQTNAVHQVLKGCRAAEFYWWCTEVGGRSTLLLCVHLPLRHTVEMHSIRTRQRVAACYVPEGCCLLRFSSAQGSKAGGGLLIAPSGAVFRLEIGFPTLSKGGTPESCIRAPVAGGCVGANDSPSVDTSIDSSLLRACRNPEDFLQFVQQIPLPAAHLRSGEEGSESHIVENGEEFRNYRKKLREVISTIQHRFAPGLCDIFTIPLPPNTAFSLRINSSFLPPDLTSAQCLHYIHQRSIVVDSYYRLLTNKGVPAAAESFHPEQWASAIIPEDLWKIQLIGGDPAVLDFIKDAGQRFSALLAGNTAEQTIFTKHFLPHLRAELKESLPHPVPYLPAAELSSMMTVKSFTALFFSGTCKITFLRAVVQQTEDGGDGADYMGQLSDVVFWMKGLSGLLTQLPTLIELGMGSEDVALLTLSWAARQGARGFPMLFQQTSVGMFLLVLLTLSDENFLRAVERCLIPFVAVSGEVMKREMSRAISSLLFCCLARNAVQPMARLELRDRLLRVSRQLLQLWKAVQDIRTLPEEQQHDGCPTQLAVPLRLMYVEPRNADEACGDAIEAYLLQNGIVMALLEGFRIPRTDGGVELSKRLPVISQLLTVMNNACIGQNGMFPTSWIQNEEWQSSVFESEALQPLAELWEQMGPSAGPRSPVRYDNVDSLPFLKASLAVVLMVTLEKVMRPLTDIPFLFWDADGVPDANFFPITASSKECLLSGSRTTRDYLRSVEKLAELLDTVLSQVSSLLDNAARVKVIQHITSFLSADDALLFPAIPRQLRQLLRLWIQMLAQFPRAAQRRTRRVLSFARLLLLFSAASALHMAGMPLTQLQSHLRVPWKLLIGGTNRPSQLMLFPPVSSSISAAEEQQLVGVGCEVQRPPVFSSYEVEEESQSCPIHRETALSLLRQFIVVGITLCDPKGNGESVMAIDAVDTRECVSQLAKSLDLLEALPDIVAVAIFDYKIKNLYLVSSIELELPAVFQKGCRSRVAACNIQILLYLCIKYISALQQYADQNGDRARMDSLAVTRRNAIAVLSDDCRTWIRQVAETEKGSAKGSTSSTASPLDGVGGPGWVTIAEEKSLTKSVLQCLQLPSSDSHRKNFFQLLFLLAQWSCEGRNFLPPNTQRVVRELPIVVEKWTSLL